MKKGLEPAFAAENATYNRSVIENLNYVQIDKQSITDTIKQVE